jgi:hypothetical protein
MAASPSRAATSLSAIASTPGIPNPPAASRLATSSPPDRRAQIPASAAVAGGVQDWKACGGTPSTLTVRPLITTRPPATASTARTPASPPMALTCAAVIPVGTTATTSGTISWRGR